ncbi:MAG: hypothetical protein MI919_03250 [Holophagales bacterium]|nr:hypothetical protein [Holophagales bacterium]
MKKSIVALLLASLLLTPQAALAVITFDQLSDDTFFVTHRVKLFGGRGQAVRLVYEKAASLCLAAGFRHFEILDQESQTFQHEEQANAGIRVRYFFEAGADRIDCEGLASDRYIEQADLELHRKGYRPPAQREPAADTGACTEEQVTAMADLGLSEAQVEAACGV